MKDLNNLNVGGYSHVELTLRTPKDTQTAKNNTIAPTEKQGTLQIDQKFNFSGVIPGRRNADGDTFMPVSGK